MNWIVGVLRQSPELAIFLTLAVGFALGKLRIGSFSLGSVTGVLLTGVLVGQLGFDIDPLVKSTFFLLFLFAVGYSVGPQFVHSLRREGLPQILFAVVVCTSILLCVWAAAVVCRLGVGGAAGLLSGANTISAVIGVATDTIEGLAADQSVKEGYIKDIPVAYAITYIFGTAGTAWFLSSVGPKILGGNLAEQCRQYEQEHGGSTEEPDPTLEYAYDGTSFMALRTEGPFFERGKTVAETEQMLLERGWPVYIERMRTGQGDIVPEPAQDRIINRGDIVVLNGPLDTLLSDENTIGTEVADLELLDFRVEALKVIVSNKGPVGTTLGELRTSRDRHGVTIRRVKRGNVYVPMLKELALQRGDVVEIEGRKADVDRFASHLGYPERPTTVTDLLYVGLGIFLGGLLSSLVLRVGNIPVSLSISGGVLIAGIVFGWLRSLRPTFGAVPEPAIWIMNNLGLNVFIAVVGLTAGPAFISGLRTSGLVLFAAGIFVSLTPMVIGLFAGKYLFRFHNGITLGACAGSRTTTAALGAIEEVAHSRVPALAYTTTYAIGNTLLIIWGVVIVLLTS